MQRFIDFMKKQGMVMVQTLQSPSQPGPPEQMRDDTSKISVEVQPAKKLKKNNQGMNQKGIDDNSSVVTIYHNAVSQVPEQKQNQQFQVQNQMPK